MQHFKQDGVGEQGTGFSFPMTGWPGPAAQAAGGQIPQQLLYPYAMPPGMQYPAYLYNPAMMQGMPMPLPAGTGPDGKLKRRRKNKHVKLEGAPKKPATSFVMFSNAQREQVKQEFPGLNFIDVGKKLGEMWREMDPAVKKEWEEKATLAKDEYLAEKKRWLECRSAQTGLLPPGAE